MAPRRIAPEEARRLMAEEGYVYIDVRSVPEFDAGHPEGAHNVPLAHLGPQGMAPNPEFLDVMQRNFPQDVRLVVGCKSGGRSLQAASLLQAAGYKDVIDQQGGFDGFPGNRGWRPAGLACATTPMAGHDYASLRTRK